MDNLTRNVAFGIIALLTLHPTLSAQSTVNAIVSYEVPLSGEPELTLSNGTINLIYEACIQAKPNFDVSIVLQGYFSNIRTLCGLGTSLFATRGRAFDMRASLVCGLGFPETTGIDLVVGSIIKNHFRVLKNWDLVIAPAIEWRAPLVSTIGAQPRLVASLGAGVAYRKGE